MPWYIEFMWFTRPLEKIAEHGVSREEVEYVVRAARAAAIYQSRTSEHQMVSGKTKAGRHIAVVFDWADDVTVAPVTAYDVED